MILPGDKVTHRKYPVFRDMTVLGYESVNLSGMWVRCRYSCDLEQHEVIFHERYLVDASSPSVGERRYGRSGVVVLGQAGRQEPGYGRMLGHDG